jgi:hypothetical protein
VDAFVLARAVQGMLIDAQDNVAKGHGSRTVGQNDAYDAHEPESRCRAVGFEDAIDDLGFTAGDKVR